jgi:hypothetical protein
VEGGRAVEDKASASSSPMSGGVEEPSVPHCRRTGAVTMIGRRRISGQPQTCSRWVTGGRVVGLGVAAVVIEMGGS